MAHDSTGIFWIRSVNWNEEQEQSTWAYQPGSLVVEELGYVEVMRPDKALQEADLVRDLGVGRGVLRRRREGAVEQLGHDVLLEPLLGTHARKHRQISQSEAFNKTRREDTRNNNNYYY